MKTRLLSVLALLPSGLAQVTVPATPAPGLPVSAPTLTLSAPVGTQVELQSTTTSRTAISNVQVTALPGSAASAEELAAIKRSMLSVMGGAGAVTMKGKLFFRVAGRDTGGSVTLVSSVVQSVPGQPPITFKITQTVAQDGAVSGLKFQSDDATLNAALAGLDGKKLQQLVDQSNSNFAGVYGRPLVVGQPRSQTVTLDPTGLLSGVFSALAAQPDLPDLFGRVQSTPLTVTTLTTYGGLNAQGLHAFTHSSKYDRWNGKVGGKGDGAGFEVELKGGQASGTQTYRKDGLPGPTTQTVRMVMNMTMAVDGVQVRLTMTTVQTVTATLR